MAQTQYDASLDVKLAEKSVVVGSNKFVAEVYSYNGGMKKVSLKRLFKGNEGEYINAKNFGRMTKDEVGAVAELLSSISQEV